MSADAAHKQLYIAISRIQCASAVQQPLPCTVTTLTSRGAVVLLEEVQRAPVLQHPAETRQLRCPEVAQALSHRMQYVHTNPRLACSCKHPGIQCNVPRP